MRVSNIVMTMGAVVVIAAATLPADAGQLLGSDVWPHTIIDIDRDTARATTIGVHGVCSLTGLAYDSNNDHLYGVAPCVDALYLLDRFTGEATMVGDVGTLGYGNPNGLAYDPINDILYGTDNNTNALFTIDRQAGTSSEIAIIGGGYTEIEGLGFDPATQTLYGLTQLQRRIVSIDVTTGIATAVSGELPEATWRGLDWDPEMGVLWLTAVNIFGDAPLYRFDPENGRLHFVGDIIGCESVQGLAYVPEPSCLLLCIAAIPLISRRRS